ncbi:BQ2448_463 [Microbotryum intermedium]|uniref:BQ2448_463 protein n=1 Tax=Microbotryum intermedium TaxID=269621 RepID=A0A238F2I3_9BASI|nr:BQ2448_463 [Microbotryum intermedium]
MTRQFKPSMGLLVLVSFLHHLVPVFAHIEMVHPYPINSKYDPQTLEANKDYTMTAPLFANGANFPCKGYNTASAYSNLNSVDTLVSGTSYTVELAGTAVHGGGSCQFSVSYDQGKTFAVIASIIGGCPIGLKFTIPIPNLPSAKKATFAWTWFNLIGNREEYQNCAIVDIQGPPQQTSYTGPSPFRANTFADGSCITTEGQEVVFPNPGNSVQYLGSSTKASPATIFSNCAYDQDNTVVIAPSSGSSSSTTTSGGVSSATTRSTTTAVASPTTSRRTTVTLVTTSASPTTKSSTTTKTPTTKTTTTKKTTTAKTTTSTKRSSTKTLAPAATPSAPSSAQTTYLRCETSTTFSLCVQGGSTCYFMGNVAPGTICSGSQIIMAP